MIYCDADIRKVETFSSDDLPIKWEPVGRGGTRVQPVFDWIAQNLPEPPACLIYLTDMEVSDFPQSDPGYNLLWVQVGNSPYAEYCKVGEIVKMSD